MRREQATIDEKPPEVNRLPFQIETLIIRLKKEHPSWGAPNIREKIRRRHSEIALPAISTVHAVLDRHGLVTFDEEAIRVECAQNPFAAQVLPMSPE